MRVPTLFATLLALAGICYFPGLSGPFILDDVNLRVIAEIGGLDDLRDLWRYLTSDRSGLFGRPISNLSFLANYDSWPTSPFPFKITNLALHLLIAPLLYWLARNLLRNGSPSQQANLVALIISAFWVLNPLNISTTLYVIQRMAMLSTLFMLSGLLLYLHGRRVLAEGSLRGYGWMTTGILLFTALAILSKENGALLPLLALVLEYTVVRHYLKLSEPHLWWSLVFLWLPSLFLLLLLLHYGSPSAYATRDFSLLERLLTEPRILIEYIYYWFNPFAASRGVLASDYPLSSSLLSPWKTLPALLAVLGSIIWAIQQRQRYPLISLAILFYFAGHLMESTVVPLELYFEHRNYLPAIFLILPVAAWVVRSNEKYRLLLPLAVVILLAQGFQTHRLANIWGSELKLAAWWAHHNPHASRAQGYFATVLSNAGRPDLALQVLEKAIANKPDDSHFYLLKLNYTCRLGPLDALQLDLLRQQLARFPIRKGHYSILKKSMLLAASNQCEGFSSKDASSLISILSAHSGSKSDYNGYAQLMHILGQAKIHEAQPEQAIEAFKVSLKYRPDIQVGLEQVALLGTHGYYEQGLTWLENISLLPRPSTMRERGRSWDIDAEIRRMRKILEEDLGKSG